MNFKPTPSWKELFDFLPTSFVIHINYTVFSCLGWLIGNVFRAETLVRVGYMEKHKTRRCFAVTINKIKLGKFPEKWYKKTQFLFFSFTNTYPKFETIFIQITTTKLFCFYQQHLTMWKICFKDNYSVFMLTFIN